MKHHPYQTPVLEMSRRGAGYGGMRRPLRGGTIGVGPIVASVSPAVGPKAGGTAITIAGTRFTGATGADVGGAVGSFSADSDVQVSGTSHAHAAGLVAAGVTTPLGTDYGGAFTYQADTLALTARSTAVLGSSWIYASAFNTTTGRLGCVGETNGAAPTGAYSDDAGLTYTASAMPAADSWNDVKWLPEYGWWVALGVSGGLAVVATSVDFITWVSRTPGALSTAKHALAYNGAVLVAVGALTLTALGIMSSADGGVTWTNRTSALSGGSLRDVAYASGLGMFVVVSDSAGTGCIQTSVDAITWVAQVGVAGAWNSLAYSAARNQLVIGGDAGTTQRSTNATSWTSGTVGAGWSYIESVEWSALKAVYVACGAGTKNFGISVDGAAWTTSLEGGDAPDWYGLSVNPATGDVIAFDLETFTDDTVPYTGALS